MDRGNRSFLVATALLTLPTALLIAPCWGAETPNSGVQTPSVSQPDEANSAQSAGVQRAFLEENAEGTASKPVIQQTGLFSSLFGNSSSQSPTPADRTPSSGPDRQPVNWDGVPYHDAHAAMPPARSQQPIRDPSTNTGRTRIIRGGASRTVDATIPTPHRAAPTPHRAAPTPTIASRPSSRLVVPKPAPEPVAARPAKRSLSSSSSSRRSSRRAIVPLEVNATDQSSPDSAPEAATGTNLVPRVARRVIRGEKPTTRETKTAPLQSTSPAPAKETDAAASIAHAAADQPKSSVPEADDSTAATEPAQHGSSRRTRPAPSVASGSDKQPTALETIAGDSGSGVSTHTEPLLPQPSAQPGPSAQPEPSAIGEGSLPAKNAAESFSMPRMELPREVVEHSPSNFVAREPETDASSQTPHADTPDQQLADNSSSTQDMTSLLQSSRSDSTKITVRPISDRSSATNIGTPTDFASRRSAQRASRSNGRETVATMEQPGIRVVTSGPGQIMIRQTHPYEIRVENRGSIDAENLVVRALIPDWASIQGQSASHGKVTSQTQPSGKRLIWKLDALPAGKIERLAVRLQAARSGTYELDVDWTLLPQTSVATIRVQQPELKLSIDGPDEIVFGQSKTYKVRVLNPGDGVAPGVVFTLSPDSTTPQIQKIGDIPPGKEAQFEVELMAQDLGDLKIQGLATGDLNLRAETTKTIRVAAAKLQAVLSGPESKYQNADAMYHLELINAGSAPSQNVVAKLRLPAGVKYLGGLEAAGLETDGQVDGVLSWKIDSLAPGATLEYEFRCEMVSTGEQVFAFDCQGTAGGSTDVSIGTDVSAIADLVLSVNDPPAPAPIGSDVAYEIVIRNRGSKAATDVRAVAQFSHGIEPQRVEGQPAELLTGQVLFDPIPRIAAGAEVRLRVIAQAELAGHHRFRTEIRSGDTVLVAEEATHYMSPKSERVSRRSDESPAR